MTADQVGVLALLTCVPTVVGLATIEGHPCSIYICCTDPAEGSRLQGSLRKTFPTEDHLSKLRNMPNLRRKHIELAKMKRQRNTFQKKEQMKSQKITLNKMEICNLPSKAFKVMTIKMLNKLWKRMDENSENFKKKVEHLK